MDYLRSDEEQEEVLKQWLKKNGLSLVGAVVLGIGGVVGYQQWTTFEASRIADASVRYQQVVELSTLDFSNPEQAAQYESLLGLAASLREAHASHQYAPLAAGIVAAQAVERGDFDLAVSQLTYAEEALDPPELKAMMRLRLAQLEWQLGALDAALNRLSLINEPNLLGSVAELKGDVLVDQGQLVEARAAYAEARRVRVDEGLSTALIDLKLSALPEES